MRISTTLGALLLILTAGTADAAKTTIDWYLGHQNLDYFEEAAAAFKKQVEEGSGGELAVRIVLNPGPEKEIAGMVARGEAQMGHSFTDVVGALEPSLLAFQAPYQFRGYRHMEGVIDGPVGSEMLDGLRRHGLAGLAFTYSGGMSGVATVGKPISKPEDLKGLKVGAYPDPVSRAWLEALGAVPVAIGHDVEALNERAHKGELDAVATTWRNFQKPRLDKEFGHVGLMGATYLVSVTYANAKFLDSLPAKHRELILKASRETGRIERAKTIELNASAKRQMLAEGVRASHLSAAAKAAFEAALKPAYAKTIESVVGKELLAKIAAAPDAPAQPSIPDGLATVWPVGPAP